VLRDHPLFRSPRAIEVTKTVAVPTPESFRAEIRAQHIDVLPLVLNRQASQEPGWCTYTYEHEGAPELEVFCGGINSKTPRAGAVWRQGNLLHFGFEPSPERMNEAGKALLVNAICYIARFTDDRPLVRTPCVFVGGKRIFDRGAVARLLANPERDLKDLRYYLAKPAYAAIEGKRRDEVRVWYQSVAGYLHPGDDGNLAVDVDAQTFGVAPANPDFFEKAIAALAEPDRAPLVRRLLGRYAPGGPGADATAERWRSWRQENGPYLFFSDTGGYRWQLDPLAKQRGTPMAQLRGPARATRPPLGGEQRSSRARPAAGH
jgi:hypothetical protein